MLRCWPSRNVCSDIQPGTFYPPTQWMDEICCERQIIEKQKQNKQLEASPITVIISRIKTKEPSVEPMDRRRTLVGLGWAGLHHRMAGIDFVDLPISSHGSIFWVFLLFPFGNNKPTSEYINRGRSSVDSSADKDV